jgi:hypothetical protein
MVPRKLVDSFLFLERFIASINRVAQEDEEIEQAFLNFDNHCVISQKNLMPINGFSIYYSTNSIS